MFCRKFLKLDKNETKKYFSAQNCTFNHPLDARDDKVTVSVYFLSNLLNTVIRLLLSFQMFDSKGTRNRLSLLPSVSSSKSSLDPLSSFDGFDDPLSQFARQEVDPLSQMAAEFEATNISNNA